MNSCYPVLQDPNVLAVQANEILTAIIQGMRKEEPRSVCAPFSLHISPYYILDSCHRVHSHCLFR